MTLQQKIANGVTWLMGAWEQEEVEDNRGDRVTCFPSAVKCPVTNCEDQGSYTVCYNTEKLNRCHIYRKTV